MKYRDCFIRLESLNSIVTPSFSELKDVKDKSDYIPSVKFLYAVTRNKQRLEKIVEDLKSTIKEAPEYKLYQEEREKLNVKHAQKDQSGEAKKETVMISGEMRQRYVIDGFADENSSYNKEFRKLKEKFKDAIEQMDKKFESYNKMLDEECKDYIPYMIDESELPKGLSPQAFEALIDCIREEGETNEKAKEKK